MTVPFMIDQFYGVFRDDNTAAQPGQWILAARGLAAVVAALRPQPWTGVAMSAGLGLFWAWIALAYNLDFFTRKDGVMEMLPWDRGLAVYQPQDGMLIPMALQAAWMRPEGRGAYFVGCVKALHFEFLP